MGGSFAIMALMNKGMYKSVQKGIPALVCVPTDKKITINGKSYTILKMFYDINGDYMPLATLRP